VPKCEYNGCLREARLFEILPLSQAKFWLCVEHYDEMASYYKYEVRRDGDQWCRDMVKTNGW